MHARRGCSVLLISLRAHGDSTGEFNDIGYGARHDVVAGVEFLEKLRPGRPIILHGVSMGAAAAIFASEPLGGRVKGYVLETPYQDLKIAARNRTRAHLPPVFEWVAYHGLLTVAPLVIPELDRISPLAAIGGIPGDVPILLLAGSADRLARPEEARALFDQISKHATLVLFEGCDHRNLQAHAPDRFSQAIVPFVEGLRASSKRE
jgi:alpha-beta hydrolase superfamily lysophospholipase